MKKLIELSRELVENLFNGNKQKLGKEHFFMFSVSKFVLLKEKIVKKDSINNSLYFNNVKNRNYIPVILSFAEEIKKNGTYQRNQTEIILEDNNEKSQELDEALWIFNKVRDSLVHGKYTIDLENNCLLINNDHSTDVYNAYKLVCSIPIQLINSISFYIEKVNEIKDEDDLSIEYRNYIEKFANSYDIDDKLFYSNYISNIKHYSNELNIDNSKIYLDNYVKDDFNKEKGDDFNFLDGAINSNYILNNLTYQELSRLIKKLLRYKPSNQKQKEQIQQIIKEFKNLVGQNESSVKQENFDARSSELMREISDILGIKEGTQNTDGIIALYTYMNLVFSQESEIDYSHICLRDLYLNFDPFNKGTNISYSNEINHITRLCTEFSEDMVNKLKMYYANPNEGFRYSLMNKYANFYTEIMNSIGNRNKLILTSIRNSVDHGNYCADKNGNLLLYDLPDQNDNKGIKFLCFSDPSKLFEITKNIELGNAKDKYIMDDFFKELERIVDDTTLANIMNIMNDLSKIIFGKDIDTENSMEHMYHEAIVNIIRPISKK